MCPPRVIVFDETDSTNNEAKRLVNSGTEGPVLIVARKQTAGRGRQGKGFYSPADTGIYMTLLLPFGAAFESSVTVTTAAAAAVAAAIERTTGIEVGIKWVNDIYVGGKKICGILAEAVNDYETGLVKEVIIGVGINVTTEMFPDDIKDSAASLGKADLDKNRLIAAVTAELMKIAGKIGDISYLEYYRERSVVLGKRINFTENGRTFSGIAEDIDNTGGLIVATESDGSCVRRVLRSGEITVRTTGELL